MKKLNLIIAGAAVVALLSMPLVAEAQGRGPGGGGGQNRGAGGPGGMRGPQMPKSMLLVRNDVQKDLQITEQQKSQLEQIRKDSEAKMQALMESMRGSGGSQGNRGGGDFQAMREQFEKLQAETDAAVLKVLNETQAKRLDQIQLQFQGARAFSDEKVQKELGLKADQKRQIDELNQQMQAANRQIMQRVQNGELDRSEVPALMEQNNKALETEIKKVLTPEQLKQFEDMQGPKFNRDPKDDEAMRSMGGRGGRGGGGG